MAYFSKVPILKVQKSKLLLGVNCYRIFFFWKITNPNISKIWCKEFLIGCLSQEKKNRWGHLTCNLPILWSTQSVFNDIFRLRGLNENRLHQNKAFIKGFRWVVCKINSDYSYGRSLTFFYFWNHPPQLIKMRFEIF